MIFFTADLHLGHKNIIKHCYRSFETIEQMDDEILGQINHSIGRSDQLYIIGDFALGGSSIVEDYRRRIICPQIFLILGNHDRLSAAQYEKAGFIVKGHLADIKIEEQAITLCHYAMRRWNKSHRGAWQLYGHSHGHLPDDRSLFSFDVGVDCHGYKPISFETVSILMANRVWAFAACNHPAEDFEYVSCVTKNLGL